jgi:ketopantoate hydroxymethyltransferase
MSKAVEEYTAEVRAGSFPTLKESFQMDPEALAELTRPKS